MARVVLAVGSSHGPSIQVSSDQWPKLGEGDTRDPRFNYQELLKQAKPGLDKEILPEVQAKRHAAAHAALAKLRRLTAEAGRDPASLPITIFRVPDVLDQLKFCRDIGVDRVTFSLPAEKEATILPILDRWAELQRQL